MLYREFISINARIFGLHGGDKKSCGCGNKQCKAAFKHPLSDNWQNSPEWSDEQLDAMEAKGNFKTGYGVLVKNRFLVVDVDARNGGIESYARLYNDLGGVLAECGLIVSTGSGSGSKHLYFNYSGAALQGKLPGYPGVDFKSTGYVVGPGSMHSSGKRYGFLAGGVDSISDAPPGLVKLLAKPEYHRAEVNGHAVDVSDEEIADMLSYINPDCERESWIRIGMAIHHATNGGGLALWDAWSSKGDKYPGSSSLDYQYHSFGKSANPVTLGTLVFYAEQAGWVRPVTFLADVATEFIDVSSLSSGAIGDDELPCNIDDVDLLRPPGFVGELTSWINDQCRFKREHLAVATALVGIGNIAGLRYIDEHTGATANLFAFCVADSATGKEAILQSLIAIHRAAGVHHAHHGSFKSEQEIIRNLIRHQAAYYVVDELGIQLQKVINAQEGGKSPYLEGVIGALMSVYSKANGVLPLTGDIKNEIINKIVLQIDKGNGDIDALKAELARAENGLENPFISLIGYTTSITFKGLFTKLQAQSGFIGRALLMQEHDTNPKPKKSYADAPMPLPMQVMLMNLYNGGEYEGGVSRIERKGSLIKVQSTRSAIDLMDSISDWLFYVYAEEHKAIGMEAVVRRGFEMLSKVSLILAIPSGLRTAEHVRWSFALVKKDIDTKCRLVYATEEKGPRALEQKILGVISKEHAELVGIIVNRCRPEKKDDVLNAICSLEKQRIIKKTVSLHPKNKKLIEKWIVS